MSTGERSAGCHRYGGRGGDCVGAVRVWVAHDGAPPVGVRPV